MAAFIDNFKRYCGAESLAWLIAVNVGIWAFTGIASLICDATGTSSAWTHSMLALSSEPAVALRHPWTAATYMVTQYSLMHMLFNMLWLFWFGRLFLAFFSSEADSREPQPISSRRFPETPRPAHISWARRRR